MSSDLALFRRRLLRNPKQISAIAPSSRALATAMTDGLGPHTGRVVEFGPGTGRLTRAVLDRGIAPHDLTLFEMDAEFGHHLRKKFPSVHVYIGPAQDCTRKVAKGVKAVISGLPLLSMPVGLRRDIVMAAFSILAPGAPMIQFTYGLRAPLPAELIEELSLSVEVGALVWANLPPARVFRFRRG